jgi:hypothetical protein
MPIDLTLDLSDNDCIDSSLCNQGNYFVGSSRTYAYYVDWFKDPWQFSPKGLKFFCDYDATAGYKPGDYLQGWYSNGFFYDKGFILQEGIIKTDPRCISSFAIGNPFWFENQYVGQAEKTDTFRLHKMHGMVSESINEINGQVVKWRDDGRYLGIASPLFLSFWFGCGEPCYPCTYESVDCGWPWSMMNSLTDNIDNYWDVDNKDHFPYFNTGFVLDWYGRIARGPEPNIGWYEYTVLNSVNCNYCHCVAFCILRQCIDGWFAVREYEAKIFLLDRIGGVPYSDQKFLDDWGREMQSKFNFGEKDIKLNHLADESVFIGGKADHMLGTISAEEGSYGIDLYGKKIPTINEFEYNSSDNKIPEASFTTGDGNKKYVVDGFKGAISSGGKITITDVAVKNKNQKFISGIGNFGWIHCDIPSGINPEFADVKFSADGGASFGDIVERQCPSLGCELTRTFFDLKLQRLFCRTSKKNGELLPYQKATRNDYSDDEPWWSAGTVTYDGPIYKQKYYKRYVKKAIKAPYNLYVKSGEQSFRSCKLGETLKDLSPGRYYFPNPVQCDTFFQHTDQSSIVDESTIEIEPSEEREFRQIFSLNLNQFRGKDNNILDLAERYREAVRILGSPAGSSVRLEVNISPAVEVPASATSSNLSANILNSIAELASAGKLDAATIALLQKAGLL